MKNGYKTYRVILDDGFGAFAVTVRAKNSIMAASNARKSAHREVSPTGSTFEVEKVVLCTGDYEREIRPPSRKSLRKVH